MIITDRNQICHIHKNKKVITTSIGGAPIHNGHCRLVKQCKYAVQEEIDKTHGSIIDRMGHVFSSNFSETILIVIVNSDEFLIRKHGYVFQNENDRAEIVDSIKGVDYTYIHHSDSQFIDEAIRYFQPDYLCKGGDRSGPQYMPEVELQACSDVGTTILYGVGGFDKVSSSSTLISNAVEHYSKDLLDELEYYRGLNSSFY